MANGLVFFFQHSNTPILRFQDLHEVKVLQKFSIVTLSNMNTIFMLNLSMERAIINSCLDRAIKQVEGPCREI